MKYLLLISLIFCSATYLAAQSDTTIIYLDNNEKPCDKAKATRYAVQNKEMDHWKKVVFDIWDDKPIYGAYYKDANCLEFDGSYNAFNKERKIITSGRYLNNKKIRIWKSFSNDGKLIDSAFYKDGFIYGIALTWYAEGIVRDSLFFEDSGNGIEKSYWRDGKPMESGAFVSGKKSGLWIFNYRNGTKSQEVKYEADSAISFTCYDEKGDIQTKDCFYEKEAFFKDGDNAWLKYLGNKLSSAKFPKAYREGKIYGTAYIQFVVDSDGKIIDVKTLTSVDPELDKIAINIIQHSPRWEPAVLNNRNVKAYRRQPITFPKVQ